MPTAPASADPPRERRSGLSRRALLAAAGTSGAALLGGCTGSPTDGSTDTPTETSTARPPSTTATPPEMTASETETPETTTPASARRVLYLYGDVAADGTVPSGDADPFHQMRLTDTGRLGMSAFAAALDAAGFVTDEGYDAETPLTRSSLAPYDVVILGSNQHRFDDAERAAVRAWVEAGGGLVAWSDSAFGGSFREVGVCNPAGRRSNNDLTAQFGMTFLRDNGAGNYRIREYARDHFLNDGDADGGVVFRGEGVSCVRVSPPATLLARLQSGGLDGELRVCSADAPYRPERDAALAVASVGDGRVVGTFDRNTFWNGGPGTDITEADNRVYAQRLVRWAAGDGSD